MCVCVCLVSLCVWSTLVERHSCYTFILSAPLLSIVFLFVFDVCLYVLLDVLYYLMYCDACSNQLMYKQLKHGICLLDEAFILQFQYFFDVFIYVYYPFIYLGFKCVLNVCMLCHYVQLFIRLLYASVHLFLLSIACAFSSVFLSKKAKKIVLISFSFESFRLINLNITQLVCNSFDLVYVNQIEGVTRPVN